MPTTRGISLKIDLANDPALPGPPLRSEGGAGLPGGATVVAVMLALEDDPPHGEVQLGTLRWRFANRVEMLEAIDAACEEATHIRS